MGGLITAASQFALTCRQANRPAQVTDLAIMNLVDWFAVTIGARAEPAGVKVAQVVREWGMQGRSPLIVGGTSAPMGAALVNGTLAHCLDYDDLHFPSLSHLSAPTWAAVLAVGASVAADECAMIDAFLAGFEVGARLGDNGVGKAVTDRGWHSTGVHGRLSAAIAAATLLGLDQNGIAHAMAIAATQTSGLTSSFGTMAKPFHAGKAAADGVLAAQLAAQGFEGALDILDSERSLARALVQDGSVTMSLDGLGETWEIERNALKPYACCGLTHAPIDCARELFAGFGSGKLEINAIERIVVETHSLASKVANQRTPRTSLAGKFSLSYCVSLGLNGYTASEADFQLDRLSNANIQSLERRVQLDTDDALEPSAARMRVEYTNGTQHSAAISVSLGNPENPMTWEHLQQKFTPLARPTVGEKTDELFATLRDFERPGAFATALALL